METKALDAVTLAALVFSLMQAVKMIPLLTQPRRWVLPWIAIALSLALVYGWHYIQTADLALMALVAALGAMGLYQKTTASTNPPAEGGNP